MKTQEEEQDRSKNIGDTALLVTAIVVIILTVIYVYEIIIFFSGNKMLPSLINYFQEL